VKTGLSLPNELFADVAAGDIDAGLFQAAVGQGPIGGMGVVFTAHHGSPCLGIRSDCSAFFLQK